LLGEPIHFFSDLELKLSGTETNQTGQNEDQQGIKTNQSEKSEKIKKKIKKM
jgi:hypothetical protein